MPRAAAIQMDPVGALRVVTDSTLLLGLEAQRRGYALFCYEPRHLRWNQGRVEALASPLALRADPSDYYTLGDARLLDLSTVDVILMRQDPPFNMSYLSAAYMLGMLHPKPLVVNDPAAVRDLPEKIFPLRFAPFAPPTLITADCTAIEAFRDEHQDIVLKPLYGYAGRSVVRVKRDDTNFHALLELLLQSAQEPIIAQKFLPDVRTGDRRIILIDGDYAGIMGRLPAEDDIRANFRVGGSPARAEITPRQRLICEAVGPVLRERGLLLAGLDVIGDWLTEINITCPTGLPAINRLYGLTLEARVWDAIERRL